MSRMALRIRMATWVWRPGCQVRTSFGPQKKTRTASPIADQRAVEFAQTDPSPIEDEQREALWTREDVRDGFDTLAKGWRQIYSSSVGKEVVDESRKCPMCGHTTWVLLDGYSTLQALEGGLEALAYSCDGVASSAGIEWIRPHVRPNART